ncbi:hypothetical protein H4Q26_007145 [Puccinia striiformis f. sp. tritici PST-130]|nr:hypothetical protein Pst134EB_003827 [Puccinia striiformis f. sp. tritici]KAI9610146.1 hypothetical protein H4Q26_007145 [Puccinia striiformis f. sp. tritici PST-130]KNE97892.1 hypothetical protein PSTG_08914 [Puccinia striiformis f. sp. tritici PST-78]
MNSNERFHLLELTCINFLDWEGKVISVLRLKDLHDLVVDKEEKHRDEKGQFAAKEKDPIRIHQLNPAHAIIYTRIHSSLTGRLSQNGGKNCPIVLWTNIQAFGAAKKKAPSFKAWYKINHLKLCTNNIAEFTSEYWNCIATLQSLDKVTEPASLGHALLAKIPASLSHIQDAIIAADPSEASALLTRKCPQGPHLPSATHTSDNCFSIHPKKLIDFQKAIKAKQEAEAHLAMFVPPSTYNVEATQCQDNNNTDLVNSFQALSSKFTKDDSHDHQSEVSLM